MAKRRNSENALVEDLILSCAGEKVTMAESQKAVRSLCRYFGGQMVYVPARKEDGESARKLRGVVADAVGDRAAKAVVEKIMLLYGNLQIYFPMERNAFSTAIALEIYERSGKNGTTMNDLAREYGISSMQAYRLWKKGQKEKFRPSMPYLPYLEMADGDERTPRHE